MADIYTTLESGKVVYLYTVPIVVFGYERTNKYYIISNANKLEDGCVFDD